MDGPFTTTSGLKESAINGDELDTNEDYQPNESSLTTPYEHMKPMALFLLKTKEIRKF